MLERERRRGVRDETPELREDVLEVPRDRVLADHEPDAMSRLLLARSNQPQHLELTTRQPVRIRSRERRCAARSGFAPRRSKMFLAPPRARALPPPGRRAAGTPHRRARASGRSRTAPRAPARRRAPAATRTRAACASPSDELHRAPCVRNHRSNIALSYPRASSSSSSHARRALSTVADGEHDLDVRREQTRAVERPRHRRFRSPNRCRRGVGASLREAQLREPRLRLPAECARLPCTRPRRRRTRPAAGGALPGDSAPGPPPGSSSRRSALPRGVPRSSASRQAPSSCSISARCTRQRPVNATISGCSSHQSESARVHSRARRTSYTSWQARMTPQ